MASRLPVKPDMRVLETACGTGIVTRQLLDRMRGHGVLVATDLNDAMIAHARSSLIAEPGLLEWQTADATNLPFPDGSFDTVVCQFGLMFFPDKAAGIPVTEWIEKPGLPAGAPRPESAAFTRVEFQAKEFLDGKLPARGTGWGTWSTQERLRFLRSLATPLAVERMAELDRELGLTGSGNAEIAFQWLLMAISSRYAPAQERLEAFLIGIGRRKFIKPLYEELWKTPEGQARARAIYRKARPGYHPIGRDTVDRIVGWEG